MGKVNGFPYISVIIETPANASNGETDTWCETVVFFEGTHQYIFAFTSSKEDFEKHRSEFEKIINTIDFE